jgi:phage/plasmid-like protein (TIGR03299 family)
MSAGIYQHDKVVSLKPTWHKLENIVEEIIFGNSGLDWLVEKRPIFIPVGMEQSQVDGWQAIVRKDNNLVLNIPKKSYEIIQNSRVFEAIENSLVGVKHTIEVTGSLMNCRKVFISIAIDGKQDYLANGDKFKNFLTFATSHDGSLALEAYDTATRVVCQNTLNASRRDKGILNLSVLHKKNAEIKIEKMEQNLTELFEFRDEFYKSLEFLASRPMTVEQANKVLTGFIGRGDELSTRSENQIEEMVGLFQHGKGNNGKTVYDLLNGVTEYYTHNASENKAKAFASNEFGSAGEKKMDFYELCLSDAELNKLAAQGEKLLKAQSAVTVAVA